jgi:midasin
MDSSWADSQLLSDPTSSDLPPELLLALTSGHGQRYLEALALTALQPGFLNKIFTLYEPLIPELAARWINSRDSGVDTLQIISAFARILPLAPYLKSFTNEFLPSRQDEVFSLLSQSKQLALIDLDERRLHQLLLSVFRLLSHDSRTFANHVSPIQLQSLLGHSNRPIRYLAIRVFCLYMHAADSTMQDMLTKYLGDSDIEGEWEGIDIDYLFLSLWEEKRLKDLQDELQSKRYGRHVAEISSQSRFSREDFHSQTAEIAGILLPRISPGNPDPSHLVYTETTNANRFKIAKGLLLSRPILVTGEAGCGKTSLITDVARELCVSSSLITLHLNEQTDAKMLLGTYTSTKPGSFSWQPGVLSRAVREGRWLLLEDIDRAPSEVISVILPLLEKGELLIPSRKERFRAPPGFRIIATMRTTLNQIGEEIIAGRTMLGVRLFQRVRVGSMGPDEIKDVIQSLFPLLRAHSPGIMAIFGQLGILLNTNYATKSAYGRSINVRDLIKFARRVDGCLQSSGYKTGFEAVSEVITDEIFMHAMDCFAAPVADDWLRSAIIDCIAKEMQIAPQKVQYCLRERSPTMTEYENAIQVGRGRVSRFKQRVKNSSMSSLRHPTFANTRHALRTLEQLTAAIQYSEPVLLVGETGIGKTALIQQLAQMTGQTLTVVNLSQQSESGDMLGGFKPVNIRSLAIPMVEEFESLFNQTFSSRKNAKYLMSLSKNVTKGNWNRVVSFWQEGLRMADSLSLPNGSDDMNDHAAQPAKKRKLDAPKHAKLKDRWMRFSSNLKNLEMHLADGGTKFAFSFVEGKIVKAVRNGEWVLLDEINLASPSTLESIADLFNNGREERPSLLLPDSGVIERIHANGNFRVFAAMNPATDAGKRDLFAGIRSRFTEIYVESPDKELKDLLLLVKTYLGRLTDNDERAVLDIARLYMDAKQMAAENTLTDGAGQKPHFSIRTLVRALIYVADHALTYGLRRALYEGFSMSFLTVLSKSSEQSLIPLVDRYILGTHKNVRSLLGQTPQAPKGPTEYVQFKHYWMATGPLIPQEQPHYIITPFIERNLLNLVRATSTKRFPILLQGPTSSGKTSMIEYLAKISGNNFVRINNHEHTDLQEYLGSYASDEDGRLSFQEGILVQALRHGYWIVLDELNLAPTDVLEALNRLLDENRELFLPETQEIVRPHPNFMLFATQNPAGLYGGRKVLSRAFRNRFLELHFDDIPEDELEYILQERSQIAPSFCTRIVAVYKKLAILRQSNRLFEQKNSFATLRDLFRWALRKADNREQLAINGYLLLAERVRNPQEKAAVKRVIEEVMKVNILEQEIYSTPKLVPHLEGGDNISFNRVIWTPSMRRLYTLVSRAIENNEPVLLIGETGCGKTQLCQALSASLGKHLEILNAHMNTEAGDLIGAQRPVRNRAQIEQQLALDFQALFQGLGISFSGGQTLETLKGMFSALEDSQINQCPGDLLQRIRRNNLKARSLFEWADGSLVNAMKAGHHFLLDEISLADDSVLERLNSVLEPHRTLLLAEKGPTDSLVVAADGFQFLATMNPGGDYGKRELSAALRNRLTEVWVPPLTDDEDIIPILEAKIESAPKNTARHMVSFCRWFRETFHNTLSSSISIRDLLAWVDFVNHQSSMGSLKPIIHGAAMVFIDTLGANPAAMVAAVAADIEVERSRCLDKLGALLECDASEIYHTPTSIRLDKMSLAVGPFNVFRLSAEEIDPDFIFEAPTTRLNTMRLIRAMQLPKPILLEGSPGVGKTTTIVALSHALGQRLTRINLSEQTDLTDLFGNDIPVEGAEAGHFAWRDAPFLTAMQKGEWVLLDEMNLASQSVLEGLNSCLDHRGEVYIAELDQTFSRHPDFKLFAAQNPHHQGGGRKGLPASFVNRFTVVFADAFKMADLQLISSRLFPKMNQQKAAKLLEFVACLNDALLPPTRFGADGAPWEVNLRDIIRWLKLVSNVPGDLHPKEFIDVILRQRFRTTHDRQQVTELFLQKFDDSPMQKSFYHNLAPNFYQVGHGILPRNLLSQAHEISNLEIFPNRLPIVESLLLCVRYNWPCILVGQAGCGKSTVLNHLAAISGSKLVEVAMNPEIDTMDLVGGFEQVDPQRQLSTFLETVWTYTRDLVLGMTAQNTQSSQLESLIQLMRLVSSTNPPLSDIQHALVQLANNSEDVTFLTFSRDCAALSKAHQDPDTVKFEWSDGILIDALQKGHWVVLDNANLCTSSVLDRLNSLLEPGGCLIVNEKLGPDGQAQVVKPHPDFRIFMTMDPGHGELSRAMRNRAIEIFISDTDENHSDRSDLPLRYGCESSMDTFRCFQAIDWHTVPEYTWNSVFEEIFSRFSFSDYKFVHRWERSMQRGLGLLNKEQTMLLRLAMDRAVQVVPRDNFKSFYDIATLTTAYKHLEYAVGISNPLGVSQPLHSLVNEPFVPLMIGPEVSTLPFDLASIYELRLQVAGLLLGTMTNNAKTHTTRLPRNPGGRGKSVPSDMINDLTSSLWAMMRDILNRISQVAGAKEVS